MGYSPCGTKSRTQLKRLSTKLQKTQDESVSLDEKIFLKVLVPFIYGPLDPFKGLGEVLKIYYMNHFLVRFAKIRYFS